MGSWWSMIVGNERDGNYSSDEDADEVDTPSTDKLTRRISVAALNHFRKHDLGRWSTIDEVVIELDYNNYHFPFENLAFEGGGAKGYAYIGALQVIEEVGINTQIRRVAGASIGCIPAAFFAVGCTAHEVANFLDYDPSYSVYDSRFGYLSLLPNLISRFGWLPGQRLEKLFADVIGRKTGNPDLTFKELYDKTGMELCITGTNLNTMAAEYFHVKTTPHTPIKTAMRITMTIPGLMIPLQLKVKGQTDYFVDGGLTCNFPIYVFDGWWLSLKPEDSFFKRLQSISQVSQLLEHSHRFGGTNYKTLGLRLYSNDEGDPYQDVLESRRGAELPTKLPDTTHYRNYRRNQRVQRRTAKDHNTCIKAVEALFAALDKHDRNNDQKISLEELKDAFADTEVFKKHNRDYLFGPNVTAEEAFGEILENGENEIDFNTLTEFIERSGIELQSQFLGYRRRSTAITSFFTYLNAIQETLTTTIERYQMTREDVTRTVGINTGYITTLDFRLETGDKDFLIEQGRKSMEAFLKYHAYEQDLPERKLVKSKSGHIQDILSPSPKFNGSTMFF